MVKLRPRVKRIMRSNKRLTIKEAKGVARFQENDLRKQITSRNKLLSGLRKRKKLTKTFERDIKKEIKNIRKKI